MRVLVRLIATLLGLAAVLAGALLVIEVVWVALRPGSSGLVVPWAATRTTLESVSWEHTAVRVSAVVLALVGLLLLIAAAKARRTDIRLRDPAPAVTVTTDSRSLARLVGAHAREHNGVVSAGARASRHRITVKAIGEPDQAEELRETLSTSIHEAIRELPLEAFPTVSVSVSPAKEPK